MFETVWDIPVCLKGNRHRRVPLWACAAILSLALLNAGCMKKKPVRAWVPPALPAPKILDLKPPAIDDPPELVLLTEEASNEPVVVDSGSVDFPPPPRPAPVARRPQPPKPQPAPAAAIETPAAPRIAQMFTPEQLRENNRVLDESLDRVQKALETLTKKFLTKEQHDKMEQIREIQTQAKQARAEDLVSAVSLAKRADLLVRDLLDHLP